MPRRNLMLSWLAGSLIMDLSERYNPYDFANPVSEESLLVGREKEMDEIKYYLRQCQNSATPDKYRAAWLAGIR